MTAGLRIIMVNTGTIAKSTDNRQSNGVHVCKLDYLRLVTVVVFLVRCVFKAKRPVCNCSVDSASSDLFGDGLSIESFCALNKVQEQVNK